MQHDTHMKGWVMYRGNVHKSAEKEKEAEWHSDEGRHFLNINLKPHTGSA